MEQRKASGIIKRPDRRREPRVNLDLPVATFHGATPRRYRLVDLSCAGAQIDRGKGDAPPPVHTMELNLGSGGVLRMLARTVWVSGNRHAVRFLAVDDVDRLAIAEGIDQLITIRRAQMIA